MSEISCFLACHWFKRYHWAIFSRDCGFYNLAVAHVALLFCEFSDLVSLALQTPIWIAVLKYPAIFKTLAWEVELCITLYMNWGLILSRSVLKWHSHMRMHIKCEILLGSGRRTGERSGLDWEKRRSLDRLSFFRNIDLALGFYSFLVFSLLFRR